MIQATEGLALSNHVYASVFPIVKVGVEQGHEISLGQGFDESEIFSGDVVLDCWGEDGHPEVLIRQRRKEMRLHEVGQRLASLLPRPLWLWLESEASMARL